VLLARHPLVLRAHPKPLEREPVLLPVPALLVLPGEADFLEWLPVELLMESS